VATGKRHVKIVPSGGGGGSITHGSQVDSTNVGLHVATTNTHPGFLYDSGSAFAANAISGSGTSGSPYVIDRRRYTQDVRVRDTAGIYAKFTNCKFEGNGGGNQTTTGTPSGSNYLWVEATGAYVTIEDSTACGTSGPTTSDTAGGCDKGFYFAVPFAVRRCDVSMANVQIGMNIDRPADFVSFIEECYLHHTWSSSVSADHTDVINGNAHASSVHVLRCKLDGIRTGNTFVTNGWGIYDDPADASGIIEDWLIQDCWVDRCATELLCTNSTSRLLNPFVVTGTIWGDNFTLSRFIGRSPSTQSGNQTPGGTPLTF